MKNKFYYLSIVLMILISNSFALTLDFSQLQSFGSTGYRLGLSEGFGSDTKYMYVPIGQATFEIENTQLININFININLAHTTVNFATIMINQSTGRVTQLLGYNDNAIKFTPDNIDFCTLSCLDRISIAKVKASQS